MEFSGALDTFYAESDELLESMEEDLLNLEDVDDKLESLNAIFRAAHTIKGSSGIFGLNHIVEFTHVVESVLDRARESKIQVDSVLISVLLKCRDHIASLVHISESEYRSDKKLTQISGELIASLTPWTTHSSKNSSSEPDKQQTGISINDSAGTTTDKEQIQSGLWHISIRLNKNCLKDGMDPVSFIRYLGTIGSINFIETITSNLPEYQQYEAENLYFAYELSLKAETDLQTLEDAFMFVQEESDITIIPPNSNAADYVKLIQSLPEEDSRLGEILVACGSISKKTLSKALIRQIEQGMENKNESRIGEVLLEQKSVSEEIVEAALQKQKESEKNKKQKEISFVRVESDRLDYLINLIGELVINNQRVDIISERINDNFLNEAIESLGRFTEKIRDAALDLRMVPIGGTFQRFKRVVRDTAQELGKEINLVIEGAETELDRLMVEKLVDPLTHIVRNAIDHGIEPIEERKKANKENVGTLKLSAYHQAGHIVIEISDDGKGLDQNKLMGKAIERGIIEEGQQLSRQEIFQLIFHPGFSTAENVTNLSGRGVGMDVVKRNVESLQGSVEISSELSIGTTLRIRLPLTLAIIDGFHVESRGTHFIIPQATIIECMDFTMHKTDTNRQCINLRGEMIPYIRLSQVFCLSESNCRTIEQTDKKHRDKLVVVQFGEHVASIVVDELHGEIQTVVKPMGQIFQNLKGIGGSTLLGNGEIAFIIDVPQLIDLAVGLESTHPDLDRLSENE